MLQRPAALLSEVGSRLWSTSNSNTNDEGNYQEGSNSNATTSSAGARSIATEPEHAGSNNRKKRTGYPATLLERFSNRNGSSQNNQSSTSKSEKEKHNHHAASPSHSYSHSIPDISIAPTNHRENTAFHALRDTFVFPSPLSFLPALPTIPCMSGLGQSNLFSNNSNSNGSGTILRPHDDSAYHPSTSSSKHGHGAKGPIFRGMKGTVESEENDVQHHQKAGALFIGGNKHDSFKKLEGLNVLMLGGYRGSILRDAHSGRRLWAPLRVGFNVRKAELAIGLTEEDELKSEFLAKCYKHCLLPDRTTNLTFFSITSSLFFFSTTLSVTATETVVPGKCLAAIAGFVDLGKRLKDRLKQMDKDGQIHFHGWGYDWRRSLDLSS